MRGSLPICVLFAASLSLCAQTAPQTEVGASDASITFQSKVSLVQVPVVVRDKTGKPIGNLSKEDFQLFDKGKPQVISRFAIEKAGINAIVVEPPQGKLAGRKDRRRVVAERDPSRPFRSMVFRRRSYPVRRPCAGLGEPRRSISPRVLKNPIAPRSSPPPGKPQ